MPRFFSFERMLISEFDCKGKTYTTRLTWAIMRDRLKGDDKGISGKQATGLIYLYEGLF